MFILWWKEKKKEREKETGQSLVSGQFQVQHLWAIISVRSSRQVMVIKIRQEIKFPEAN